MSRTITSFHNQRVKDAAKLRSRRHRDRQQRILIDGRTRNPKSHRRRGADVGGVCLPRPGEHPEAQHLLEVFDDLRVETSQVAADVFERLVYGDRNEGVLAVAGQPSTSINRLPPPEPQGTTGILVGVEKPGNVGAVVRSADAAGVEAIIVADGATDLFNPNAIRASLGTIFTVPVCCATTEETIAWLRKHDVKIFAARVDATQMYTDVDLTGAVALALGSESRGLPAEWDIDEVTPIGLPMHGTADSLNVSTTATVLFYEALRQRRHNAGE